MASLTVLAPVAGTVVATADIDDPVFSAGLVGPGTAVEPDDGGEVVAPITGRIVKMHPHAFVVQHDDGHAVLVHLGIDTVQLGGGVP
jgi:PTS system N-acetylglucosamine-specific IIA component